LKKGLRITGPGIEIRGAALASVIGQFSAFIWITGYYFLSGRSYLKFDRHSGFLE